MDEQLADGGEQRGRVLKDSSDCLRLLEYVGGSSGGIYEEQEWMCHTCVVQSGARDSSGGNGVEVADTITCSVQGQSSCVRIDPRTQTSD